MPRGFDLDAQIAYGSSAVSFHAVTHAIKQYGIVRVAEVEKISVRHVLSIIAKPHHQRGCSQSYLTRQSSYGRLLSDGENLFKSSSGRLQSTG
jgi:hypothetical protein